MLGLKRHRGSLGTVGFHGKSSQVCVWVGVSAVVCVDVCECGCVLVCVNEDVCVFVGG